MNISDLKIKLFADGADLDEMLKLAELPYIKGFTTNPTLMRKAGVLDFEKFALQVLEEISDRPISFEVFSDEFDEMERQAHIIHNWAANVYIKIPVTNTRGEPSYPLIHKLATAGLKLNVTASMTLEQVEKISRSLVEDVPAVVSVFAGRIADTGRDPIPVMQRALEIVSERPKAELLWASPRELLNIVQADEIGCHIITATDNILKKIPLLGKGLDEYSLDTVKMFHSDAHKAGFSL